MYILRDGGGEGGAIIRWAWMFSLLLWFLLQNCMTVGGSHIACSVATTRRDAQQLGAQIDSAGKKVLACKTLDDPLMHNSVSGIYTIRLRTTLVILITHNVAF